MPDFRTIDLNLLRVFDAVMSEGSATRAASALATTQPGVSQALRRLRDALGDELFTRTPQGLKPTPQAERLWPQVRAALAALRDAIAPEHYDPQRDAASWRLLMTDATAARLVPQLVAALEPLAAPIDLRVLPLLTRDPGPALEAGDADLALGVFAGVAPDAAFGAGAVRSLLLYETRYVCVMRSSHALARCALDLDAFCAARHLKVSFAGRIRGQVDQALAALGRTRRVVLTVGQYITAGRVVAQSELLAVLPESVLAATGCGDRLVARELPFALPPVQVAMLWHQRHDARPAHRWLRERVQAAAAAVSSGAGASRALSR